MEGFSQIAIETPNPYYLKQAKTVKETSIDSTWLNLTLTITLTLTNSSPMKIRTKPPPPYGHRLKMVNGDHASV